MAKARKLRYFILCFAVGLQITPSTGHEHPRRHHHGFRKGRYESQVIGWNPYLTHPVFEDSVPTVSQEKQEGWNDSVPYKENHSFDSVGSTHHSKNVIKESKKNFRKIPKGSILTSSSSFLNETNDTGSITYSEHSSYVGNKVYKNTDFMESDTNSDSKEPVPAATRARDKEPPQNNYLSAPRWTLKYQGMASEQALNNTKTNVTAPVGGSAFLPCKVGHLGDRQISWIRRRDWHVLTSGKILYSHDQRFSVLHEPGSQDWTLHIKWVDMKDTGTYECQVSTGTGIISLFVKLRVVIPEAYIPGDGQYHVNRGSSISLNCYIKNSPSAPQYILWHHNGQLLNFLRNRPDIVITDNLDGNRNIFGLNIDIDNGVDSGLFEDLELEKMFISRLRVDFADDDHSGNYTCSVPNTEAASTLVFITEGDKTAAVQRIDSSCSRVMVNNVFTPALLFINVILLS